MHALTCNYYPHFLNLMGFCPAIPNHKKYIELLLDAIPRDFNQNGFSVGHGWENATIRRRGGGASFQRDHHPRSSVRSYCPASIKHQVLVFSNLLPRLRERALIDLFGTLVPRRLCRKSKFLPPFHAREFRTIGLAGVGQKKED